MFCLFRWETEKEKSPIYILNIRSYKGIRHDTDKNTWKHIRVWWIIRGYDIIVIWKAWMASGLWQCKYQSSHTERELLHCYPNRELDQPFEEFKALLSAAIPWCPWCVICVTLRTTSVTLSTFFTISFHPIFDFPFWYLCSEHLLRIHNCKSLWQTMGWQLSCTCTHIVLDFYVTEYSLQSTKECFWDLREQRDIAAIPYQQTMIMKTDKQQTTPLKDCTKPVTELKAMQPTVTCKITDIQD